MHIVTGSALVLVTWCVALLVLGAVGLPASLAVERGRTSPQTVARALWWGLLVLAVLLAFLAAVTPLRSSLAAGTLALIAIGCALAGGWVVRRRGWAGGLHWTREAVIAVVGIGVALVVLAVSALGPVTNYDTGLYHLGAVRYAMDYATIPGLANLYGPLGYGNAEFTLAALLGNGPLGPAGYRALNGLVIAVACVDLVVRLLARRWSGGTWVLLVGLTASVTPMLVMADYWITSPSQDAPVLFVTVVASAYLVDALCGRRRWVPDAATVIALGILLILLRPTMIVFVAVALVVLVMQGWGCRGDRSVLPRRRSVAVVSGVGILAAAATALRDYLLSGWLLYPLSILPFDVSWRAADPVGLREATLGFWRNRTDMWASVDGWAWVGPWLANLPRQWEVYLLLLLLAAAMGALVLAAWVGTVRWRRLTIAVAPSASAVLAWWLVTPPGFRFGWGPVFTLLTIPLGWALWRITICQPGSASTLRRLCAASAAVVLVSTAAVAVKWQTNWDSYTAEQSASMGPVVVPFVLSPLFEPSVTTVLAGSDLRLLVPTGSDQCWAAFPLCTPTPSQSLRLRGEEIQGGFVP